MQLVAFILSLVFIGDTRFFKLLEVQSTSFDLIISSGLCKRNNSAGAELTNIFSFYKQS